MEINKESTNKKRLGRGLGSLLGGPSLESLSENEGADVFEVAPGSSALRENNHREVAAAKPNQTAQKQNAILTQTEVANENRIWNIAVDKVVPGVYQPRKNFNKESLSELAASIKENGIVQPITVRKRKEGGFEIIAGERRWRAAQAAGLHEVPAIIKTISNREALQIALIENIQREDLDPVEEAESFARLIEEFNLSQAEAAEKVGKERSTVANALRLLGLPREVRDMLSQKLISVGHAKVILSVADKTKQIYLAKRAAEKQMSVRGLENEIKFTPKNPTAENQKDSALGSDMATKLVQEIADQMQKALGTKVQINYRGGKGHVEVHFYSDDQLTQIFEKLKA
jgi:ParB family chromosome partitioning protein